MFKNRIVRLVVGAICIAIIGYAIGGVEKLIIGEIGFGIGVLFSELERKHPPNTA